MGGNLDLQGKEVVEGHHLGEGVEDHIQVVGVEAEAVPYLLQEEEVEGGEEVGLLQVWVGEEGEEEEQAVGGPLPLVVGVCS